jgi:energy-converting hydrogenase Eha subunit A
VTSSDTLDGLQLVRLPRAQKAVRATWSLAEKHPVRASFLVAAVLRVIAAVGITLFSGYLFGDESQYVVLGRLAAAGHLTPTFWSGYGETLFHTAGSYMWPTVVLFKLFGVHPLVAALWAALFGALTAALTAAIAGRALSRGWSALAGLTVAIFPSQILWSSVVLRESMVWAGLAAAAYGILIFSRAKTWQSLAGATILVGVGLLSIAFLRSWAFLAAAWATALAVWLFRPARPVLTRTLCALLCLLVPLASGLGLAGSTYIRHHGQQLGYERSVLSVGAKSAFVHPKLVAAPGSRSAGQGSGSKTTGSKTTGSKGAGPPPTKVVPTTTVVTAPSAVADEDMVVPSGLGNDLRALPTGLVAFALRPFPWQRGAGLSYDFAGVEELLYYPLYLLALVGVVAYRRRRDLIAFPLVVTVFITGIASEAEGNLGSAFRHRDQLFWAVAFFAALGANHLWARWRRPKNNERKTREEEPPPVLGDERPLTAQASR